MLKELKTILTKAEKIEMFFISLASVMLSLSEVISIGMLIPIILLFVNPQKIHSITALNRLYQLSGAGKDIDFIVMLSLAAVIVFLLKTAYSILVLYWQHSLVGRIYSRLTGDILDYYLKKEYSFHLLSNSSVLFKNISIEVSNFTSYFLMPIILITSEVIMLFSILVFMLFLYPAVSSLLFFIFGGLLVLINLSIKNKMNTYAGGRVVYSEQYYKNALESLSAVKEIQAFGVYDFFVDRFRKAVRGYNDSYIKFNILSSLPRGILEAVIFSSFLLIVITGILMGRDYREVIPMMIIMGIVALRVLPSISKISGNVSIFHFSSNSLSMVYNMVRDREISAPAAVPNKCQAPENKNADSIRLKDITFSYARTSKKIFDGLDITIPFNAATAFVGETGAGKSTLVDIIMGLLIPLKGDIYYGSEAVKPDTVNLYRKKIGYVPQNIFLFDDTICANIALGVPAGEIDFKRLEQAVKAAVLEDFIMGLPGGVNTPIGERGVRISGGQKQRIAIARALYRDPEIIIFDEATSALDMHTERDLYNNIRLSKKTVILVTHRLNTVRNADMIYVMDKGKIIDRGNFEDLSARCHFFQKIIKQKEDAWRVI